MSSATVHQGPGPVFEAIVGIDTFRKGRSAEQIQVRDGAGLCVFPLAVVRGLGEPQAAAGAVTCRDGGR
jgi:hypothetical protein